MPGTWMETPSRVPGIFLCTCYAPKGQFNPAQGNTLGSDGAKKRTLKSLPPTLLPAGRGEAF